MAGILRTWSGVIVAGAIAVTAWLADDWILSPSLVGESQGWVVASLLATTLVAGSAYRSRRDPAMLFIALGAGIVAGQSVLFQSLVRAATDEDVVISLVRRMSDVASLAALASSLALGICLLLTHPWWDRRGRPPLRPGLAIVAGVGAILAVDLSLVVARPTGSIDEGPLGLVREPGPAHWALGLLALAVMVVAAVRALTARTPTGWTSGAALAFALTIVAALAYPFVTTASAASTLLTWAVVLVPAAGLMLLGTPLGAQRSALSYMRRASDRAAEVMQGRAEIAATIAHDVRGPVGTIKGLATTTRKSYDRLGDAERLEFIGMIEQESGRLLRLVDQVAIALKIDAGALDLTRRSQEVAPLIHQALARVEHDDRTIEVDAADGIEAALDTRWFPEALAQGIDNAIRFSPEDTPVTVSSRGEGGAVIVDIVDRGPGIPADQRDVMFEKFSRWRPAGYEDRTGTGLGLFIARGIARVHGGDAMLIDAPAGGTMLRLRVPMEEEDR